MSGMVSLWGASSLVESIQYFSISIADGNASNTATIVAVDTSRSFIIADGWRTDSAAYTYAMEAGLVLTNSTTVTATNDITVTNRVQRGVVVTLRPGSFKSLQRVSGQNTAGSSGTTLAITSVDSAKTMLFINTRHTANGYNPMVEGVTVQFDSETALRIANGYVGSSALLYIYVLELF